MHSMRRKHGRGYDESEVNVTPLLDVVFIMLIFFIVTASFVKEATIDVSSGGAGPASAQPGDNILVAIGPSEQLWVNGRSVSLGALHANVKQAHAEKPDAKVIIAADPESSNGLLVRVIDTARLAGIDDVSLAQID